MSSTPVTIGIDVSKAQLEVAVRPSGEAWQSANEEVGIRQLVERLRALAPELIVLEASGGWEVLAASSLAEAGLPVAVVNPRQVGDFARAIGQLAKTDALDAQVLGPLRRGGAPHPSTPAGCRAAGAGRLARPPAPGAEHAGRPAPAAGHRPGPRPRPRAGRPPLAGVGAGRPG